ncbi:MAG: hypothetical protein P1V36_03850 [Planctomycetota bacterium]|nr:hypothetical protein [Planctomycetota bacterium]
MAPCSLGRVLGWWKSRTTALYAKKVHAAGWRRFRRRLWQRGFYDRVLRDREEHARAHAYILRNPTSWHVDPNNPERRA